MKFASTASLLALCAAAGGPGGTECDFPLEEDVAAYTSGGAGVSAVADATAAAITVEDATPAYGAVDL